MRVLATALLLPALGVAALKLPRLVRGAPGAPQSAPARNAHVLVHPRKTPKHPAVPQMIEGGLWRTDGDFRSVLMLKDALETSAISVTPVLFMADGTEFDLPALQLDPAGVAMVDLNTALAGAPAGLGGHVSSYGSAAVKSVWPWSAVFAA